MASLLVIRRILALTLVVTLASMGVPVPVNASGEQEQPSARNNVLTLNGQASASQRPPVKSDQQILVELEQGWNKAFYRKDVSFIEDILADEFIATYDDGSRGDKAKELALVTEFNQQVESAIQDEFTVRVYRDTAVVWFTLRLVGIRQGERAEVTLRYTDVWVVRDGRWQCVSTQSTKVNPR